MQPQRAAPSFPQLHSVPLRSFISVSGTNGFCSVKAALHRSLYAGRPGPVTALPPSRLRHHPIPRVALTPAAIAAAVNPEDLRRHGPRGLGARLSVHWFPRKIHCLARERSPSPQNLAFLVVLSFYFVDFVFHHILFSFTPLYLTRWRRALP